MTRERITTNAYEFILLIIIAFCLIGVLIKSSYAADNVLYIEQSGSGNTVNVLQDGSGHTVTLNLGIFVPIDNTTISIDQKDSGIKTASVEIKAGINNGVSISQQGNGNHTASIQNLIGSGNNINIDQSGSGNHAFTVVGANGTTNSGNTINAQQSGNSGADKAFNLNLNGTVGSSVTVQQTNQTQPNIGSMSIQCNSGSCGSYSYIRN